MKRVMAADGRLHYLYTFKQITLSSVWRKEHLLKYCVLQRIHYPNFVHG
jgi:hypothetical protein